MSCNTTKIMLSFFNLYTFANSDFDEGEGENSISKPFPGLKPLPSFGVGVRGVFCTCSKM